MSEEDSAADLLDQTQTIEFVLESSYHEEFPTLQSNSTDSSQVPSTSMSINIPEVPAGVDSAGRILVRNSEQSNNGSRRGLQPSAAESQAGSRQHRSTARSQASIPSMVHTSSSTVSSIPSAPNFPGTTPIGGTNQGATGDGTRVGPLHTIPTGNG